MLPFLLPKILLIRMITPVQNKLKDAREWALEAYDSAIQGNKYTALNNARKTGEAICKAVIYNELGPEVGEAFINGAITIKTKMPESPKAPSFAALIQAIQDDRMTNGTHFKDDQLQGYFELLRTNGNTGSHDITNRAEADISYTEVVYTMMALSSLLEYAFVTYFDKPIPAIMLYYVNKKEGHYFIAQQSKLPEFRKRRMLSLETILAQNYELLEEWEQKKVYTADPTELKKCAAEINRLKTLAKETEEEYNNLLNL